MDRLFKWIHNRRFPYDPLITVEISRSCLIHNLNEFRKISPGLVAPVLKANAYGHGIVEVADILEKENWAYGPDRGKRIPFFVVDSYYEATILRDIRIKTPVLIIGYTRPETIRRSRGMHTAFTITSLEMLKQVQEIRYAPWDWESGGDTGQMMAFLPRSKKAHRIHLKIDTGMHRQGVLVSEIDEAIKIIRQSPTIILEGICSHLSDADNPDESYTESQIVVWNKVIKIFKHEFPDLKYVHLSNTDGHVFSKEINANVSRLGIGLYGLSQNPSLIEKVNMKPVLEVKTVISSKRLVKSGERVGYGDSFVAKKDMIVATIPIGYSEGLDRRLSNIGNVLVEMNVQAQKKCPIVGRISMNITSIDVSAMPEVKIENKVTVISKNLSDDNSVANIAKTCGTIPYEVIVKIPSHLRRVVVE